MLAGGPAPEPDGAAAAAAKPGKPGRSRPRPSASASACAACAGRTGARSGPNVIVVMTDDQNDSMEGLRPDREPARRPGHDLPQQLRVASRSAAPPARPSSPGSTRTTTGWSRPSCPTATTASTTSNTLPVWLRRSGYRTAMVGKYLNGYGLNDGILEPVPDAREIPPGWAEWYALTGGQDQRRYGYRLNENGKVRRYGYSGARTTSPTCSPRRRSTFVKTPGAPPQAVLPLVQPDRAARRGPGQPGDAARDPTPAPRHLGAVGERPGARATRTSTRPTSPTSRRRSPASRR